MNAEKGVLFFMNRNRRLETVLDFLNVKCA